jgi:hypothetical protein
MTPGPRLVAAVKTAAGTVPQVLTNLVAGFDVLANQSAQQTPRRRLLRPLLTVL